MTKPKLDPRIIAGLLIVQAVVGTLTIRDLSSRQAEQVRGPKLVWKVWGGTNTLGAALYWLFGRKRTA